MKKTLILLTTLLVSSCIGETNSINAVQEVFPSATVFKIPERAYSFIVVDSLNKVSYIRLNATNGEIINVIKIK